MLVFRGGARRGGSQQRMPCYAIPTSDFMELELAIESLYATSEIETLFGDYVAGKLDIRVEEIESYLWRANISFQRTVAMKSQEADINVQKIMRHEKNLEWHLF